MKIFKFPIRGIFAQNRIFRGDHNSGDSGYFSVDPKITLYMNLIMKDEFWGEIFHRKIPGITLINDKLP